MKQWLLLSSLMFVTAVGMKAQEISGRVLDGEGNAVPFANVVLMSQKDSTMISGAVTDENGDFQVKGNYNGTFVKVSSVGYDTRFITPQGRDLGTITINEGQLLREVTVKAMRPVTKLVADGVQTSVEGTLLEKAGTANDVLRQIPGLVEKEPDKFEVIGRGTPTYYINGREVRDMNELQRLGSENIKSVDVVYNPGAKYDASTVAVVRITTKKPQGEGFSFTDRARFNQGKYFSLNNTLDLNYRKGGLDIFSTLFLNDGKSTYSSNIDNTVAADTLWSINNTQDIRSKYTSLEGTLGFNYYLNERSSFGLRYIVTKNLPYTTPVDFQSVVSADGVPYDVVNSKIGSRDDQKPTHYVNAYYDGKIGKGELFVDADFHYDNSSSTTTTSEISKSFEERQFVTISDNKNILFAGKVDYTIPVLKGALSIGAKYSNMNRDDDYYISQQYVPSSTSDIKERNTAAYLQYVHALWGGQLTAGLRYENVSFDYYQNGKHNDEESRSYNNFFPTLGYTRMIGNTTLMLNYSVDTRRPSYQELTNNVTYASRYIMQTGNPLLKTNYSHNVSAILAWKFLQFVAQYQHEKDAAIFWDEPFGKSSSVTLITMRNKSYDMLTAGVTATPSFGFWQPVASVYMLKTWLEMNSASGTFKTNVPLFQIIFQNNFRLSHGYVANLSYQLTTKSDYQNLELSATNILGAYINKSFLKNTLDVTLGVQDVFQQSGRNDPVIHGNRMLMHQTMEYPSRQAYLTIRYKFNATNSKFKGKGASESELQRLTKSEQQ